MSRRKLLAWGAALSGWLATVTGAGAHRLDEYLQATRLAIGTERVEIEIDLTAGEAVAAQVFGWLDTDGDGQVSRAEGEAYARQMLACVTLTLDERPLPIALTESRFPEFAEMRMGLGTIRLRASAAMAGGAGRHQLVYRNTHWPEKSVYLVNALVPGNARIQLRAQRRDRAQHGLTLDYRVASEAPSAWLLTPLAGLFLAGRWLLRRDAA